MARSRPSSPKASSTFELVTSSVEETQAFGKQLGRMLRAGDVVAFHGELGSGKTTLIQGIARGLGLDPGRIKSPTFVLMREYPAAASAAGEAATPAVVHVDGYRLAGAPAAAALDLALVFSPDTITLIEWAERFEELLPEERLEITMSHLSTNRRRIHLATTGGRAEGIIASIQHSALRTPQSAISSTENDDASASN